MKHRAPFIQTWLAAIAAAAVWGAAAAETYVYQEKDGTRWITDRQMDPQRFVFIDKYGRATATRSCRGVTPAILERRAGRYMPAARRIALGQQVDPDLVKAVITVESCFDARAISRAGARGLMQLMPSTAREYGVYNRFDPEDNLRAGITHLRDLLDEFQDDVSRSLAAYNAGRDNVHKYDGIPPFRETQGYVKKVLKYFERYKNTASVAPD